MQIRYDNYVCVCECVATDCKGNVMREREAAGDRVSAGRSGTAHADALTCARKLSGVPRNATD